MNKFIKRLTAEWNQHGKIIVAVDYDDTISPWGFKTDGDKSEMDFLINLLKGVKQTGAYLVIWTACHSDRFEEITQYCRERGLEIDSINKNPIDLPYGHNGKIQANIYLDDRAGLNEALNILQEAMYQQRSYLQQQK